MNSGKIHILLIEDNLPDIQLLQTNLNDYIQESGAKITLKYTVCTTYEETVKQLKTITPDIIILDLMLPDSTGLSTFTNLHKYTYDIPIIIMSGMDDEYTSFSAVQDGAQQFFIKGEWDGEELLTAIEDAIELTEILKETDQTYPDDTISFDYI